MLVKTSLELPEAFEGLFEPYRFKVFYGGRGGGKSRAFAGALSVLAASGPERILCAREVQNSIRDSVKRLLDDEIDRLGLRSMYVSTDTEIRCPATGSLFLFSGLRLNPEKLKSFEGITRVWIEEAETVSERSLDLLIPTIRADGSEIWMSYNPDRVNGAVHKKFVLNAPPPRSLVRKVTWRDNPWFPDVLDEERRHCLATDPDKYDHVWEGNPVAVARGSYYGKVLQAAKDAGRIATVPADPALLVHTAWDLGVGDSTAIWFFQFHRVGPVGEFRFIDFYEASGEGLAHYAGVLASKGYNYGKHIAPHDINVRELGSGKSRIETAEGFGIRFDVCPNIPVDDGIEAARQCISSAWFDQTKCGPGLDSLWSYQKEWDDHHGVYRTKPLHDWTSHAADAFRYAAVGFKTKEEKKGPARPYVNRRLV